MVGTDFPATEPPVLTRSSVKRAGVALWALMFLTAAALAALCLYLVFPRPPATIHRVELLTPYVEATGESVATMEGGAVRMRATVESALDPTCLTSTQYFVELDHGEGTWAMAGARFTTPGEVKYAVYQAPVPQFAPAGKAWFFIRDTYNCGVRSQRMQSPKMAFVIVGHTANGR